MGFNRTPNRRREAEFLEEDPSTKRMKIDPESLHTAVFDEDSDVVLDLLKKGVPVNALDDRGIPPLHFATNIEIARLLIDHGADVNAKNLNGETALYWAYLADNARIAEFLLQNGANFAETLKICNLPSDWTEEKFLRVMMFNDEI